MDPTSSYSEMLYSESTMHEIHSNFLLDLAKDLEDASRLLTSRAHLLQKKAFCGRKASYESESFSFDNRPTPTAPQRELDQHRVVHSAAKVAASLEYSQLITHNVKNLVACVQEDDVVNIKEAEISSAGEVFAGICRAAATSLARSYLKKENVHDAGRRPAKAAKHYHCACDPSQLCSVLPPIKKPNLKLSIPVNSLTATNATESTAQVISSKKRPAHVAFAIEQDRPEAMHLEPWSNEEEERLGVETAVLQWIPDKVTVPTSKVLGAASRLEAHPYGL